MIAPLFQKEVKSNWKLLALFCAVLTLYILVIITMFDPKLGDSLNQMMQTMPGLFAAFGMANPGTTLLSFLANYLYGFLLIAFPLVFFLMLSVRLVARYIENRSMACLLAAPHTRRSLICTQGGVLLCAAVFLWGYVTAMIALCSTLLFPGELALKPFLFVSAGLLGLFVFFCGLAFFASAAFYEMKMVTLFGAGLSVLFILIQMLAGVGDKWEKLKYATPLTLFNPTALAAGGGGCEYLWLYLAGALLFAAGGVIFCRKDIPV